MDCEAASDGNTYFVAFQEYATWQDANDTCVVSGYDGLATIQDSTENLFVADLTASILTDGFWLGYTDVETENVWKWITGSNSTYTNWFGNEPDDWGTGEDCAFFSFGSAANQWQDTTCSGSMYVFCEKR